LGLGFFVCLFVASEQQLNTQKNEPLPIVFGSFSSEDFTGAEVIDCTSRQPG